MIANSVDNIHKPFQIYEYLTFHQISLIEAYQEEFPGVFRDGTDTSQESKSRKIKDIGET